MSDYKYDYIDIDGIEAGYKLLLAAVFDEKWYNRRVSREMAKKPAIFLHPTTAKEVKVNQKLYTGSDDVKLKRALYFDRCLTFVDICEKVKINSLELKQILKQYSDVLIYNELSLLFSPYQRDILALIVYAKRNIKKDLERKIHAGIKSIDKQLMKRFELSIFELNAVKNFVEVEAVNLTIEERWELVAQRNREKKG